MSTNKRIDELDVLKGIGIILMMLDHCFAWGEKVFLHALIQSFHMPLFFIVSGYLWQNKDKTTNFIRHKVNTILVPHFNFAIIYSLVFIGLFALGKISGEGTAKSIIALFMFSTRSDLTMFASPIWFFTGTFFNRDCIYDS